MFNINQLFLKYFNLFTVNFLNFLMCLLLCESLRLNYCVFLIFMYVKIFKNILKMMSNAFNMKIFNYILFFNFMRNIIM